MSAATNAEPPKAAKAQVRRAKRERTFLIMERETGFEPATSTLARSHSTTELFPLCSQLKYHMHWT